MAINNALNIKGSIPAFRAKAGIQYAGITGDGTEYTVRLDTVLYDTTSSFNTTTYEYTVPMDGRYLFVFTCSHSMQLVEYTNAYHYITVNSNKYTVWQGYKIPYIYYGIIRSSALTINLNESDIVKAQFAVYGDGKEVTSGGTPSVEDMCLSGVYLASV